MVERAIVGFHRDDAGDWVAELSCAHRRHIRHNPPFRVAPWILDPVQRQARIGSLIDCGLCETERPPDVVG
jgi:tellurite methyltransferase